MTNICNRHKFIVPADHMNIFPQYIIHEVVSQQTGGVDPYFYWMEDYNIKRMIE